MRTKLCNSKTRSHLVIDEGAGILIATGAAKMYQGVAKASAAFRLMQQMGWAEGDGLGRERQGIKEHLRVRKKQDNAGLGLSQKALAQANWMLNTKTYENILSNLKVVAVENPEVQQDKGTSDPVYEVRHKDEPKEAEQAEDPKSSTLKSSHGRANKKRQKKAVGTYSNIEVDEVLGVSKEDTLIESVQVISASQSDAVITDESATAKAQKVSHQVSEQQSSKKGSSNLWWCLFGFVKAGSLGSSSALETSVTKSKSAGFQERDQENLYNLVFETATKSKRGLGVTEKHSSKRRKGGHFLGGTNPSAQVFKTNFSPDRCESIDVNEDRAGNGTQGKKKEKEMKEKKVKKEKTEKMERGGGNEEKATAEEQCECTETVKSKKRKKRQKSKDLKQKRQL